MFRKILLILILALLLGVGYYAIIPDVAKFKKENPQKTSLMEYREQEWQKQGKKIKIRQLWVPLPRVSPYLIKAVLIAEDDKFWQHRGFDTEAIKRAVQEDIKQRKFKLGGSTISQQLAKNLYLSPSKNPVRKLKEAILTWRIEKNLSKKRIVELYLNVAEWGEGIFGIEAASRYYYGKSASALDAQEAVRLAAVLPNPRRFNPSNTKSSYVENRSQAIYEIMVERGIVVPEYKEVTENSEEEKTEASSKPDTPGPMIDKDTPKSNTQTISSPVLNKPQ